MNNAAIQQEALQRARNGESGANYAAILRGFIDKGIPEEDIKPRVNVFTYQAWKGLGRQVKRGEHGVKCITFIETTDKRTGKTERRPWTTTVFHITQTQPIGERTPEPEMVRIVCSNTLIWGNDLDATGDNVPYAGDEDTPSEPGQREMPLEVSAPVLLSAGHNLTDGAITVAPIQPEVVAPEKHCAKCGSVDIRHAEDTLCPRCKAMSGQQVSILDLIPTKAERAMQKARSYNTANRYYTRPQPRPTTKDVEF